MVLNCHVLIIILGFIRVAQRQIGLDVDIEDLSRYRGFK